MRKTNVPAIVAKGNDVKDSVTIMLDTGSDVNLIKIGALRKPQNIDGDSKLALLGINKDPVFTVGKTYVELFGYDIEFNVVDDDFPTIHPALLGAKFFNEYGARVLFDCKRFAFYDVEVPFFETETERLPPNSVCSIKIKTTSDSHYHGQVPRIYCATDLEIGGTYETNDHGTFLRAYNNLDHEVLIPKPVVRLIPSLWLDESDYASDLKPIRLVDDFSRDSISTANSCLQPHRVVFNTSRRIKDALSDAKKTSEIEESRVFTISEDLKTPERAHRVIDSVHLTAELSDSHRVEIKNLINNNQDLFYLDRDDLGSTNEILHRIITTDDHPVFKKQYRFPPIHKEEISRQVRELEQKGIIRPSESGYCSPIWLVKKKEDSLGNPRWRLVVDFRELNEKTFTVVYPTPNIIEIIDQTGDAEWFSTFDLANGFHQIKIHPDDIHKTAFSTPHQHYEFGRMPFGLKNAPPTFQRLMNKVLVDMIGRGVFVYMDDIVVYSKTFEEHIAKIKELFIRLRKAGLQLQPDKCHLFLKEINYLGHIISANGVRPDPKKTDAVEKFPAPNSVKKVREFLGLTGYYRRFIDNYAKVSKPLTFLLQKDIAFEWRESQVEAFETLKNKLINSPILQFPDFSREFIITTDACDYGIGACLSQGEINKDKPVSYTSRLLNSAERNYSTIEKEMLAIVYAVNQFRPYVYGSQFTLVTDHRPLTWLNSVNSPNSRIVRWRLSMEDYTYKVVYKPGRINSNVDSLSRNPVDSPEGLVHVAPVRRVDPDKTVSTPEETSIEDPTPGRKRERKTYNLRRKARALNDTPESCSDSGSDKAKKNSPPVRYVFKPRQWPMPPPLPSAPVARGIDQPGPSAALQAPHGNSADGEGEMSCSDGEPLTSPKTRENADLSSGDDYDGTSDDPQTGTSSAGDNDDDSDDERRLQTDAESSDDHRSEDGGVIDDGADVPLRPPRGRAPTTPLVRELAPNVRETRDRLSMQPDNVLVFVNVKGKPCDDGSRELADLLEIPNQLTFCRSTVIRYKSNRHCILAAPKYRDVDLVSIEDIRETLGNVYNNVQELGLESFSVAKTNKIDDLDWLTIQRELIGIFSDTEVKITICLNLVRIPDGAERLQILEEYHGSAVGGHKGMTKTYKRIRQNFFWPNVKRDVISFIQKCLDCQLKKLVRVKTRQPMVLTDTPDAGFDKIGLDIMYPTHTSASGNKYILTIQDLLTKFSMAVALEQATAVDVARALVNRWFCYFGPPKAILTDQGTNFLSSLLKNIARKYKIKQYHTTAYHPQSNGSVERSHHVLQEYIKQCISEEEDWDEYLDLASFSYNVSEHEGTGFTPYQLVFGKLPRLPSQFQAAEETNTTYTEYLEQLFRRIKQTETAARENLRRAKEKSKLYYDRKINPHRFRPGTRVFLLLEPRKSKGDPQYTGPHEVIGIGENETAEVEIDGVSRFIHINKLRISRV